MAITFKEASAWTILEKLGFYHDVIVKLKHLGYDFKLSSGGLIISDAGGLIVGSAAIGPTKLSLLKQGKLPQASKTVIENNIIAILKKHAPNDFAWPTPEIKPVSKPKSILDIVPPITKEPEPVVDPNPEPSKAWPEFPADTKTFAPLVKLRDANMMYQPVQGTSKSSRYYVVGASADLRIAARRQGGSLSVRVEGPGWSKFKGAMKLAGFQKVEESQQYASLHLNVGTDAVLLAKTLGAVLMGLGVKLDTPMPELSKVPKG